MFPYDLVEKILYKKENDEVLEAQWKALPDYVERGFNILVMAGVSGSIFWNVNSRNNVFHADARRKGIQLASGQSVTVFRQILQNFGVTPIEVMENTIYSKRYDWIAIEA